jgi:hypothetical protein
MCCLLIRLIREAEEEEMIGNRAISNQELADKGKKNISTFTAPFSFFSFSR